MLSSRAFLRAGQELREFEVLRPQIRENDLGRVIINVFASAGKFKAVLAAASSEEIERWRQLTHPVTHKIIRRGVSTAEILPGDILKCADRRFHVTAMPYNPGGLSHFTIYYCEERSDAD